MADTRLLVALVLSLLFSSLAISFIDETAPAELGNMNIYKPVNADFTTGNNTALYDVDILTMGRWTETDNGLMSDSDGTNLVYFVTQYPVNGEYVNIYEVTTDGREYEILVRETNYYGDSIRCRVTPGGIYVETKALFDIYRPYQQFIPLNVISFGENYAIKTVLDEEARTVTVYINGVAYGQANLIPEDSILSLGLNRYAGIEVTGNGFIVRSLDSSAVALDETAFDIFELFASLGGVLGWYTGTGIPVLDLFVNLVIKVQQFGIFVVIVTIIRGN